jgi:hypothetical protein
MVNFIRDVKSISLLFALMIIAASCKSQKVNSSKTMLEVIFADGFMKESVDFSIGKTLVLKNAPLSSDESDGVTSAWVHLKKDKGRFYFVSTQNQEMRQIQIDNPEKIGLSIEYKAKSISFDIEVKKGTYVIISSSQNGKLIYTQKIENPVFD